MLNLQRYLNEHGLDKLKEELGIKVYAHPSRLLVGFKYSQIDSPRTHPVVRECRGIVLEKDTWKVVAKPFNRFFNVGEVEDEFKLFDWDSFHCVNKEDGSLIIVYYYDGEWHANTSGSFGLGDAPYYKGTWRDLFWNTANIDTKELAPEYTYCFELCTPYNKVVKQYKKPGVYFLGMIYTSCSEPTSQVSETLLDTYAKILKVDRPKTYKAYSKEDVAALLMRLEDAGEIEEGVIIRDKNNRRFKWKTKKYLALHRLKDNGNIILPKRLVNIVLSGEASEVLAIMPEITSALAEVKQELKVVLGGLKLLWTVHRHAESQKEFALGIKHHPLAFLLFKLRKEKDSMTMGYVKILDKLIYENSDKVAETIFGKRTFEFDVIK